MFLQSKIELKIDIQRLVKCKFSDNFEFLRNFKQMADSLSNLPFHQRLPDEKTRDLSPYKSAHISKRNCEFTNQKGNNNNCSNCDQMQTDNDILNAENRILKKKLADLSFLLTDESNVGNVKNDALAIIHSLSPVFFEEKQSNSFDFLNDEITLHD